MGCTSIEATDTPQTDREPNGQILDADVLHQLEQLDPAGSLAVVQRVLLAYERTLDKALRELDHAVPANDWIVIGRWAHTLRSSSASIGAMGLASLCRDVELAIREQRLQGLQPRIHELQSACRSVCVAVRQLIVARGYAR